MFFCTSIQYTSHGKERPGPYLPSPQSKKNHSEDWLRVRTYCYMVNCRMQTWRIKMDRFSSAHFDSWIGLLGRDRYSACGYIPVLSPYDKAIYPHTIQYSLPMRGLILGPYISCFLCWATHGEKQEDWVEWILSWGQKIVIEAFHPSHQHQLTFKILFYIFVSILMWMYLIIFLF